MSIKKTVLAIFMPLLLVQPVLAAGTCRDVYSNSTRSVDTYSKKETELNKVYSQHCEANGSLRSSSSGSDLSVAIKSVKIGFSGSNAEAAQEMQEFCKTRNDFFNKTSTIFSVNDSVVVEALHSLNQCLLIEGQELYMSHTQDTGSVSVHGTFNPALKKVEVKNVSVTPPENGTCMYTHTRKVITTQSMPVKMNEPFTIVCTRNPQKTKDGLKYPRMEIKVDTNYGTYPVTFLPEDVYNLDLASENKRALGKLDLLRINEAERYAADKQKLEAQVAAEKQKATVLQTALTNARVTQVVDFSMGDGREVPCARHDNRPTFDEYITKTCGADRPQVIGPTSSSGGGNCGWHHYRLACLKTN